jgi:CubicO group peptidase (beta-lactamase class C family)
MKKIIYSIAVGFLVFTSLAQNPNPNVSLNNTILDLMDAESLPGLSTVIVKQGEVVWMKSFGLADVENNVPVTDSTAFLLASISKLFTGTALMQLADRGVISLNEDISDHLPFPIYNPNYEDEAITFRQLMTHTSSIKDGDALDGYYSNLDPDISLASCIQRYFSTGGEDYDPVDNFHNSAPGSLYEYSNIATALAGYLVEVISEIPFDQYCRENIFDVLCMENTDWHLADFDTNRVARPHQYVGGQYEPYNHYGFADYPDGQLRMDIRDMSNFMLTVLNSGTLNGNQILSSQSLMEMMSLQIPSLDDTQGLNWYTEELNTNNGYVTVWGHNGGESGVSTDMYLHPATGIGIAVFSNGEGDCLEIVEELYNYALGLVPTGVGGPSCGSVSTLFELPKEGSFVVPNPINKYASIYFQNNEHTRVRLSVMDFSGKEVANSLATTNEEFYFDRGNLSPGVYFYSLTTDSERSLGHGKIVVE